MHVIAEIGMTYELKAVALAQATGRTQDIDALFAEGSDPTRSASMDELMTLFDSAPSTATDCVHAATIAYMYVTSLPWGT